MTEAEFENLPNSRIKFTTNTGKVYVGGNVTDYENGKPKYYIQTIFNNLGGLSLEDKIAKGIMVPIKPLIIEGAIVIQ